MSELLDSELSKVGNPINAREPADRSLGAAKKQMNPLERALEKAPSSLALPEEIQPNGSQSPCMKWAAPRAAKLPAQGVGKRKFTIDRICGNQDHA